jgi:hypothetical protein
MPIIYDSGKIAGYDLSNISRCVPSADLVGLFPQLVFKQDAINLGVLCFIAGILFTLAMVWLDHRWKK